MDTSPTAHFACGRDKNSHSAILTATVSSDHVTFVVHVYHVLRGSVSTVLTATG